MHYVIFSSKFTYKFTKRLQRLQLLENPYRGFVLVPHWATSVPRPSGAQAVQTLNKPLDYNKGVHCRCETFHYGEPHLPFTGNCQKCFCNGLSDSCDRITGECISCTDNTSGDHCERCLDGWYGSTSAKNCTRTFSDFILQTYFAISQQEADIRTDLTSTNILRIRKCG